MSESCNCKLFLDLYPLYFNSAWLLHTLKRSSTMVATHIKKFKHSMLCVTGVYLRDITNMIVVILHLRVSDLSVRS